jgi:hypothetical protein
MTNQEAGAALPIRLRGRAAWYRDTHPGTVKTPELLDEAAALIEELVEALTSAAERLGGISLLYRGRISDEELAVYDGWAAEARALLAKIEAEGTQS